ncbi:MAG TPA: hypothetical protein VHZ03_30580 [Trebonia sp.]|jgi:hypothetical protein|nr:hypothetical protein [Trebonia sp.]
MTSTPGPGDALPAADLTAVLAGMDRLTAALDGMAGQLKAVSERLTVAEDANRTNRHIIIALVVSFCLDLLVTAGFGWNTVQVNGAQNASHDSQISACQQANVNRAQDIAIWNQFLTDIAPPGTPETAKVKAELAGLSKLVQVKDEPRNCQKLYAK